MVAPRQHPTLALIDELLADQQRLQTPVATYSRLHDNGPALAPVYRDLIPLSTPGAGEQYAFEVDLDSCSGCKACVAGCHALNGLDDEETWRDVGLVLGGDERHPFQQTITTACHHCADPGCLNGCPVLAYEKDPVTGIVRHLDDQCIGCSYCILKCPYDVPKYSKRLGIVRKCDMCHGRLAAGEAPACVQACPTQAIRIVTVALQEGAGGRPGADTSAFLPGAPDPARTQPTTRYVSRRPLPENLQPADAPAEKVQPAHTPLALLFLGTQAAVGLQWAAAGASNSASVERWSLAAVVIGAFGLASSVAHLGRPLRAWRVFLGLRRSWLSREAIVFGLWLKASLAGLLLPHLLPSAAVLAMVGSLGIACSAMIYIDTGRQAWRPSASLLRFFGTTAVCALALSQPVAAAFALLAKLGLETLLDRRGPATSRALLHRPLRRWVRSRQVLGGLGAGLLLLSPAEPAAAGCGVVLAVAGELLEKLLFFRAVDASRMPGIAAS